MLDQCLCNLKKLTFSILAGEKAEEISKFLPVRKHMEFWWTLPYVFISVFTFVKS